MNRADGMKRYWDARARENAVWYVDTTCNYEDPDMGAFFATGARVVERALLEAPVQPRGRALAVEIGSGLGRISLALSDHFDQVLGVDISAEMVGRARELVPNPRVRFEVGNGTDLMPVDASADFVITFTVLQHLPKAELIEGYLREAVRVLKPGGVLAAQWNNLPHPALWKARAAWWRARNRIGGPFALDARIEPQFTGTRLPLRRVVAALSGTGATVVGTAELGTLFAWVWAQKQEHPG